MTVKCTKKWAKPDDPLPIRIVCSAQNVDAPLIRSPNLVNSGEGPYWMIGECLYNNVILIDNETSCTWQTIMSNAKCERQVLLQHMQQLHDSTYYIHQNVGNCGEYRYIDTIVECTAAWGEGEARNRGSSFGGSSEPFGWYYLRNWFHEWIPIWNTIFQFLWYCFPRLFTSAHHLWPRIFYLKTSNGIYRWLCPSRCR